MVTIRDVADLAGFSIATVSRVLSKPETVTESTRHRVQQSIDALGYEPNFAAKSLRMARVSKILLTVPDISNPFFGSVIRGAEDAASIAGYSIVLGDTRHDEERELQYGSMLRRREVDGLIFLGHKLPPNLAQMLKTRDDAPIVNGCEHSPDLPVTSVHIDNHRAAMDAMEYLYALGHREIGVITGPLESPLSRDRLNGVRAAAASVNLSASLRVSVGDFTVDSGEREARAFLTTTKRPTAIFCFSDEMAIGALSAMRSIGLDCPGSLSLMGFDDIRFARVMHPSLSTVSQPADAIGRESVRLLLEILGGQSTGKTSITLPHQLIIRASTRALNQTVA
jgi:LacI family repressor for deo operon, udp, cdd, tsx, nupC, and nupG